MAARKKKKEPKPNATYTLPRPTFKGTCVLALDPGSKNFGISCVGVKNGKPVVLANSVLTAPLNTLVDFAPVRVAFLLEIAQWIEAFRPKGIIAERFQTRGNSGPLIEYVSVMLGLVAGKWALPVKLITASTWKNAFNRRHKDALCARYPEAPKADLKLVYPDVLTAPHPFDATLIGIYGLEGALKTQLRYTLRSIIKDVELTSRLPLRVIKPKRGKK